MIKFPYGISDFHRIRTDGYLYLDRSALLHQLEGPDRQLLFLRPRRFGKSLLLSMLGHYYDLNRVDEFDTLFGDLAIGKQPTPEHNQYMILRWDFSQVSSQGNVERITRSLFNYLNETIKGFVLRYPSLLKCAVEIHQDDAIATLESLTNAVTISGHSIYLLIDEYDNFANEVLMQTRSDESRYKDLLQGEGVLKTLFKAIKSHASEGRLSRVFITGVSPVVMSDITSGYNVATNIYLEPEFNQLCGLDAMELEALTTQVIDECALTQHESTTALETMRVHYNGYRFCYETSEPLVYNPTLCFYFLRHYQKYCSPPEQLLDSNLAMDAGKIRYIANLPEGATVIDQILDEEKPLLVDGLENQFGIEALREVQQGQKFMVSLLYFFGVLTISGRGMIGELQLGIPNLLIRRLYLQQLQRSVLPDPRDTDAVQVMAKQFYQTADLQPLADFMENRYFAVFSNRDYRWSNELTLKTAFLSLLFNDHYYVMDSESALQRRYCDLTLIIRPSMRQYPALKDIVFEFKYLTLKDVQLTGEQTKKLSMGELEQQPAVDSALQAAIQQLSSYRTALVDKYQEPDRLCCLAVVAVGFERLVWRHID